MIVDANLRDGVSIRKALSHLRRKDLRLAGLIKSAGPYRVEFRPPTFWALARSIVYQQLNGRAAKTIFDRLEAGCGELTPENVLRLTHAEMRKLGLSERKAEYIRDLAAKVRDGEIDFDALSTLSDGAVVETLTQVRGVGEWTVHMFLMFAMGRPDVLPVGDYGIRQAMKKLYELPELPKAKEMEVIAQPWRPWASVACWYLWRSLDIATPAPES